MEVLPDSEICGRGFLHLAANVNKCCEDFKLASLTPDDFKSLIFILGLRDSSLQDIRTRLHNKVDTDAAKGKLETLVAKANRLINLKADCKSGTSSKATQPFVKAPKKDSRTQPGQKRPQKSQSKKNNNNNQNRVSPKYSCMRCGGVHFTRDCEYHSHTCSTCSSLGHKEGYSAVASGMGKGNPSKYQNKSKISSVRLPTVELSNPVELSTSNGGESAVVLQMSVS